MLLSAVSVLVVAQSSSEIPEGLMNNPVLQVLRLFLIHVILEETSIQFRNGDGFRSAIVPLAPLRMSCPQSVVVDSSQEMERIKVKKFTLEQATKAQRWSRRIALLFL